MTTSDTELAEEYEAYEEAEYEDSEEDFEDYVHRRSFWRGFLKSFGSCGASMVVHAVGLFLLAFITMEPPDQTAKVEIVTAPEIRPEDEPTEIELDEIIEPVDASEEVESSTPTLGAIGGLASSLTSDSPSLDSQVIQEVASSTSDSQEVSLQDPLAGAPSFSELVAAIPEGELKGDPRSVTKDYKQAMDRISQELLWMMDKGPVLVCWVFDQSGSMKDDQREIRNRVENVYDQLGISAGDYGDWLQTSVVSYGSGYARHTRKPTSSLSLIRAAIDEIPEDTTGEEKMCQAVFQALKDHSSMAGPGKRQMVTILVTDESGEPDNNQQYLEQAIAAAQSLNCRIYVLGRESVFGYPYARIRWKHPQTQHTHWLPIHRGPETGFVEQLQTNGLRRRHDAFPSGVGPYEQCRLARETGGVFFMLPSVETNLVRGEKRDYQLDLMRPYRPDLRARQVVLTDREQSPLQASIWKVIYDLNPYRKEVAQVIEMRYAFSPQYATCVEQIRKEQGKAIQYLQYLSRVQKGFEQVGEPLRQQEADPRWQANYDLIFAQLIAYQARVWEYGAGLEAFAKKPPQVPLMKGPKARLYHWHIHNTKKTLTEESKPYIERSKALFQKVIAEHPGTPWAERASDELKRGFGIELRPEYRVPYKPPPGGVTIKPPKL